MEQGQNQEHSPRRVRRDSSLNTSANEKKGFGSSSLRTLALVLLGGVAGGLVSKATSSEAEALEQLTSLNERVATLDNSNDSAMEQLRAALEKQSETGQNMEEVNRLLGELLSNDQQSGARLQANEEALTQLKEELQRSAANGTLADAGIDSRINELKRDLNNLQEATREPSEQELWDNLVRPTVKLQSERSSGSGVLLKSKQLGPDQEYETLLITAQHVVEGIRMEWKKKSEPEPIEILMYDDRGNMVKLQAEVVSEDKGSDLALLKITSDKPLSDGVALPSRAELDDLLKTFNDVYEVGGPLGVDPVPSKGQISDSDHSVMGQRRILINAPTVPGNSGGPIMDAETYDLLGISSMVYTAPAAIGRQLVPHMAIVVPIDEIYRWLESIGRDDLIPQDEVAPLNIAQAKRK